MAMTSSSLRVGSARLRLRLTLPKGWLGSPSAAPHTASPQELRVVRIRADQLGPVFRHEHLILELDAERSAHLARIALEAQDHVLLELALGHDSPRPPRVVRVGNARA